MGISYPGVVPGSNIWKVTTDVSAEFVAPAPSFPVIVNETPTERLTEYEADTVPPSVKRLMNIRLVAVTDVYDTVTVPDTSVATPCFLLVPSSTRSPPSVEMAGLCRMSASPAGICDTKAFAVRL